MKVPLDNQTLEQISQCINLLEEVLGKDLLGVYLFGSSIVGGLQKYSDIDLFVVTNRSTTYSEKTHLASSLLTISGIYMKSAKRPIEMTIVVKSEINPWRYPPKFDFQFGDWLRPQFENGNIEPWPTKEMPDLASIITQVLLANQNLFGLSADQLLANVPYQDFITASIETLHGLLKDIDSDTRNVLLTLARIWCTLKTDTIRSKQDAALWAINRLPEEYQSVMQRAKSICVGEEDEHWDDIKSLIQPCANFMVNQINEQCSQFKSSSYINKSLKLE